MSGAYGIDGRDTVEQRSLAGAGSTHNADVFSGTDLEADVVKGFGDGALAAVVFFDVLYVEYRGGCVVADGFRSRWGCIHRCFPVSPG